MHFTSIHYQHQITDMRCMVDFLELYNAGAVTHSLIESIYNRKFCIRKPFDNTFDNILIN